MAHYVVVQTEDPNYGQKLDDGDFQCGLWCGNELKGDHETE